MGSEPDWTLVIWNWERARPQAHIKVSTSLAVYQVFFNPFDVNGGIVAIGDNLFKWYRFSDGSLKQ
jgi:hypothetical protein